MNFTNPCHLCRTLRCKHLTVYCEYGCHQTDAGECKSQTDVVWFFNYVKSYCGTQHPIHLRLRDFAYTRLRAQYPELPDQPFDTVTDEPL